MKITFDTEIYEELCTTKKIINFLIKSYNSDDEDEEENLYAPEDEDGPVLNKEDCRDKEILEGEDCDCEDCQDTREAIEHYEKRKPKFLDVCGSCEQEDCEIDKHYCDNHECYKCACGCDEEEDEEETAKWQAQEAHRDCCDFCDDGEHNK